MDQTQSDEEEATPQPGDIIEFPRFVYKHYGVAVDKKRVVHLTSADEGGASHNASANGPKAVVKIENISDVAWDHKYRINKQYDQDHVPKSREEILKDAKAKVGQKKDYNLLKSNCEHFATSMRYGVPESKQVDDGVMASAITGVTIGAVALGALIGVGVYKALNPKQPDQTR